MFNDSDFVWYTPESRKFMQGDYLLPEERLGERAWAIIQTAVAELGAACPPDFVQVFGEGLKRGWCSLSTPIWFNFGTDRGLPISCYNTHMDDTFDSLMGEAHAEMSVMSKYGGGTSTCYTPVRGRNSPIRGGRNGTSMGTIHFASHHQSMIRTSSQGSARRGSLGGYWSVRHPDLNEVLGIRSEGHPIQDKNFHFGITFDDAWMEEMRAGDKAKREVWGKVLTARKKHGEPYLLFEGAMNRGMPKWYKDAGLSISSSNLCTEVTPTSNAFESFVCCLMSLNAIRYREWRGTRFARMCVYFLDAVISEFIRKAKAIRFMERPTRYAERHRSLGIGLFGWHDLLQSEMLSFDSPEAYRLNAEVSRYLQQETVAASEQMAKDYGEPEVCKGYGRRHALLQAIAPTKSSAFIIGQASEGVGLREANVVMEDKAKGKFVWWNPYLERVLADRGVDTPAVRQQILLAGGSVQRLDCLNDHEKAVFRTAFEVPQLAIIQQAAQRQQFIDQGQSINVYIDPATPAKDVNRVHLAAWELGLKTMYYQIGENAAKTFARDLMSCTACEA